MAHSSATVLGKRRMDGHRDGRSYDSPRNKHDFLGGASSNMAVKRIKSLALRQTKGADREQGRARALTKEPHRFSTLPG